MGCIPKGRLRAYLDGELDPIEREAVARHLAGCVRCQRTARLVASAEAALTCLDVLAPEDAPDLQRAVARSGELRRGDSQTLRDERSTQMGTRIVRRPAFAIGLVLVLLAGLLSFGPGRAFARQMLSVFRVRRFAVVQMNTDPDRLKEVMAQLEDSAFVADEPEVIVAPTRTTVGSVEEASAAAGFEVRIPAYWPNGGTPRITVEGPSEQALRFRGDGLRLLLELAGMDPGAIPEELVEDEIRLTSAGAVYLRGSDVSVTQVSGVTATYPDGIDVAMLVEAGLRVMGMDADEAHRLSQEHDWTSTALIPVLPELNEVRETEIAGTAVLLVRAAEAQSTLPSRATLIMEKDGILYSVTGRASFERLAQIAQSMF